MIRLAVPATLAPQERFGLEVLVDLSRLLVVTDPAADVVTLEITDGPSVSLDLLLTQGPAVERRDGAIAIARTTLSDVTGLAGGAFELQVDAVDRHGRIPSATNVLVTRGIERDAPTQRWAKTLAQAVCDVAGRRPIRFLAPWPEARRWAAAVTHDLDVVTGWALFTLLRSIELAKGRQWHQLREVFSMALRAIGRAPVERGVRSLLEAEREVGVHSTWFVLCGTPTLASWGQGDVTYRLESTQGRRILDLVRRNGHEVGLHGSFRTAQDGARMQEERSRLARLLGAQPAGVRQHFLRFRPGQTHALMAAAGFTYDATLGFSDRNGFRTGTADALPAWGAGSRPALETVPLVWMDRALSKYRGVENPGAWIDDGLELATTARKIEGLWVGLWHPNLVPALGFPGTAAALRRLLATLAEQQPWFATLEQVVQWRRARRSTRATHVTSDGRVETVTDTPARWPVTIEAGNGRG